VDGRDTDGQLTVGIPGDILKTERPGAFKVVVEPSNLQLDPALLIRFSASV
jgi:hypothetical protein